MIAARANNRTKSPKGFTGYRFTVDQYHRMIDAGILTEDDPVELLEGWIVIKPDYVLPYAAPIIQLSNVSNGWNVYRFTVEQYHRMIEAGILTPRDRIELLEGWLVNKMAHNPPHATGITRFTRWLARVVPDDVWSLRVQLPITLQASEPEPDLVIARGPDALYVARHPGPLDVALAIEVSESSLAEDRLKVGIYATAKIPHYWIVNLVDSVIEVYTKPQSGKKPAYRSVKKYGKNDTLPLVLDGKTYGELSIKQLLS